MTEIGQLLVERLQFENLGFQDEHNEDSSLNMLIRSRHITRAYIYYLYIF